MSDHFKAQTPPIRSPVERHTSIPEIRKREIVFEIVHQLLLMRLCQDWQCCLWLIGWKLNFPLYMISHIVMRTEAINNSPVRIVYDIVCFLSTKSNAL